MSKKCEIFIKTNIFLFKKYKILDNLRLQFRLYLYNHQPRRCNEFSNKIRFSISKLAKLE